MAAWTMSRMPQRLSPKLERPWLVTGATGLLGSELVRQAAGRRPIAAAWHRRPLSPQPWPGVEPVPMDVRDAAAVFDVLARLRPAVVIHTAFCKDGPDLFPVTAAGAGIVAQAAASVGARLLHLSSDVIFDGDHARYDESAAPAPITPYAEAKAKAERLVRAAAGEAVIVRTSLICRRDPLDAISGWIAHSLRAGEPITLFTDEIRSPVWVGDLAAALLELAELPYTGVLHLAGPQAFSRYQMGCLLATRLRLDPRGITAGSSLASGLRRPRDCTLDIRLAQRLLRTPLHSFGEEIADP